jgi:ATP-dependent DNA ligase
VNLPIVPPYATMAAQLVSELPSGDEWQYEPKMDGFRCLVFRDGTMSLQSKAGQPLGRYFPDVVDAVLCVKSKRLVLDSEIVIPVNGRLSFDDLMVRIHPGKFSL